jgi:telomerase reverse transcriptase
MWIFNDYLVKLLKISFYITESTAHAKRLFYFRHDVWNRLTAPYLNALKANMYSGPLPSSDNRPSNKLRLVPKGPSFRPVVNFHSSANLAPDLLARSRVVQNGLRNLHHILYYSARNNPNLLGASLLSVDEVCSKLIHFKNSANITEKPLYFVKIDFTSCFDNIPTAKLLDVITEKALPKVLLMTSS